MASFDEEQQEELFLKELETAINPFLRDEIPIEEYLSLTENSPFTHDNCILPDDLHFSEAVESRTTSPPVKKSCPVDKDADRFSKPIENLEEWMTPIIPKNTLKNTQWAYNNFTAWIKARKGSDTPPSDVLEVCDDPSVLCDCLCKFILETRTMRGDYYTPRSLNMLLAGLHRHVSQNNPNKTMLNFLQKDHASFDGLRATCDRYYRQLRVMGIGANPKKAEIITPEEEDHLWNSGVLGIETPKALLNAVFYYNGKNFHLRGGEEHRFLHLSQLQRHFSPDRYEYTEEGSKNNPGGLADVRMQRPNKIVPIYATPTAGNRCHVKILDLYLSKIPPEAIQHDYFYLKPIKTFSSDGANKTWYTNQPVGKHILGRMVQGMFRDADLKKKATNHSLRATGTTELYRCGVPENVIKERTGHKSLDGLRAYERTFSLM